MRADTQRRLEDLPRSRHGTAPAGSVVPGSPGSLQFSLGAAFAGSVPPLRYAPGAGGGDEETRTPDPLLAKEMLCQLSYVPVDPRAREVWWAFLDSNQRPLPYQGSALTS
jgi:hypothetical protein